VAILEIDNSSIKEASNSVVESGGKVSLLIFLINSVFSTGYFWKEKGCNRDEGSWHLTRLSRAAFIHPCFHHELLVRSSVNKNTLVL
jgi:hypothetical protein